MSSRPGLLIILLAAALFGCASLREPAVPIRTLVLAPSEDARCVIILLPGMFSSPERFAREEFARIAADHGIKARVVAVDSHIGYYRNRSVAERLHSDVIAPALAAGTEEIWIVGTSLGGLGSLLYLKERPGEVHGVFAIAPFLGDDDVIDEITAAGGPAHWTPPDEIPDDDVGRILWSWIAGGGLDAVGVPVHLGWGTRDDFDRSNRLLSGILPAERTYTVDGGHDWDAWSNLWAQFLDRARPCD